MLRRFDIAPSGRYTVTALTTYVIIAIGILLVLSTLGARWSQVQWLVAALTVGIGFGLLLRCFVDSVDLRFTTASGLNEAINAKFTAAGIAVAFPQRDVHLDTQGQLRVRIENADDILVARGFSVFSCRKVLRCRTEVRPTKPRIDVQPV